MVGTTPVTKQHIVLAILFCLLFFGPMILIPFFPENRILQTLNTSGTGMVLLAVFAASTSGLITWILFRGKN
jgi:hypothetical protein